MEPYIHAETAIDLSIKLDADWRVITQRKDITGTEWEERVQLRGFLQAVAQREFLHYPVELFHTSASKPDFKLSFLDSAVGIEVSRITNEPLNRLNELQRSGKTPAVVSISHVLIPGDRMNNDALVAGTVPGGQWNAPSHERHFWLAQAVTMIDRKTRIRRKHDYQDYGENWLLLWDQLSIADRDFTTHAHLLRDALVSYWNEEQRFDKIIVQCEQLKHHVIFTNGIEHILA